MKYAVTGATGQLGYLAVEKLIENKIPASSIVAIIRDKSKAGKLENLGVEIRIANYEKPDQLKEALKSVDRLLLVSGTDFGKRFEQHKNVIDAAKSAGLKVLVYTSVFNADTSVSPVAPEHKATEAYLKSSGLEYVILRNNWYTENYTQAVQMAQGFGFIEAAVKTGKVASATRADFAQAAATVLSTDGHKGKIYELAGKPWDFNELAKTASGILGRPVEFKSVSAEARKQSLTAAGLPEGLVGFLVAVDQSIEAGALADTSPDLAKLLGRAPQTLEEGLRASLV